MATQTLATATSNAVAAVQFYLAHNQVV